MEALVDRLKAALADRYVIERELGQGGMATVYLAHDVRHDRRVAAKVLRPELAAVIGAERFLQEIRVTAHLQHPHILPLFDSGEADSFLFYVMPYVEGESLRDRLSREKQLPVDEAVQITTAVASALDYAHRHKVIHRDIKPENILLHDGQPVVADFGIALAVSVAGGHRITETGLSLGTPQYMSPEQATADRELDGRTDIYSLGCVLYEMLASEPPHTGTTVQAVIAKVLTDQPRRLRLVRDMVPVHVEAAVHKALAKLPADRFATATQFAEALTHPRIIAVPAEEPGVPPPLPAVPKLRRSLGWREWALAAVGLVLGAAAAAVWERLRELPASAVGRFVIMVPPGQQLSPPTLNPTIALSPDGSHLVYVAFAENRQRLYLRTLDQLEARPIPGTDDASMPFFSPDGNWVGFLAEGKLKKVALAGGPPLTISEGLGFALGATWSPDNIIVFTPGSTGLYRISAAGGASEPVTRVDGAKGESVHSFPEFLPGGKAFLFSVMGQRAGVAVGSLETGEVKLLVPGGWSARYAATGHIVYARSDGSLLAAPFDVGSLNITGPAVPIVGGVLTRPAGAAEFSLSRNGTLAYVSGSELVGSRITLVDRAGRAATLPAELAAYAEPRFSPNGRRIALTIARAGAQDVWVHDLEQGTLSRLTFGADSRFPAWTPDGRRVAYSAPNGAKGRDLFWVAADGSGEPELLFSADRDQWEIDWAPDGRSLVYRELHPTSARDLWALALGREGAARPLLTTSFDEHSPMISPDGRWLAYVSNESGRPEVYVRPFPGGGGRWQVSTGGGTEPVWAPSSRELFYRSGRQVIAVTVSTAPTFGVGARTVLFEGNYRVFQVHSDYDMHPDGRRFVMIKPEAESVQLVVVLNWFEELKQRLAAQESR